MPVEEHHFRSLEILFGPGLKASADFLEYLQLSGLKSAYRKRAMETHPDRISGKLHGLQQSGNTSFHTVQNAYEVLLDYLKAKEDRRGSSFCRRTYA